jgi:hypothetical protein
MQPGTFQSKCWNMASDGQLPTVAVGRLQLQSVASCYRSTFMNTSWNTSSRRFGLACPPGRAPTAAHQARPAGHVVRPVGRPLLPAQPAARRSPAAVHPASTAGPLFATSAARAPAAATPPSGLSFVVQYTRTFGSFVNSVKLSHLNNIDMQILICCIIIEPIIKLTYNYNNVAIAINPYLTGND